MRRRPDRPVAAALRRVALALALGAGAAGAQQAPVPDADPSAERHGRSIAEIVAATGSAGTAPGPVAGAGADATDGDWTWDLPVWLPPPPVPEDNPMSAAKVELGRHLFYDGRLSPDGTIACSSCHDPALAFSDGREVSIGVGGTRGHRNAPSLANVGYSPVVTWANPHMRSLEFHALVPLFADAPAEMGNGGSEAALFARLEGDPDYRARFAEAFPERAGAGDEPEVSLFTITRALGAFQRSLVSVDSPYDRYRYGGDPDAISASARLGESLFFSERLECYHCHRGFNFTDTLRTSRHRFDEVAFHNTGLYDVDGRGAYPASDQGLHDVTASPADRGRFRTPSLRNVALTAPYFHDGSAATLDEAIDHYAAGGRRIGSGERAGDGARSPLKNPLVLGFELSAVERDGLVDFLGSLTDEGFLTDPAHADPFAPGHPARAARIDAVAGPRAATAPGAARQDVPALAALALLALLGTAFALRGADRRAFPSPAVQDPLR